MDAQAEPSEDQGWIMWGDASDGAAIIAVSSPVKNADSDRDPEMRMTKQDHH